MHFFCANFHTKIANLKVQIQRGHVCYVKSTKPRKILKMRPEIGYTPEYRWFVSLLRLRRMQIEKCELVKGKMSIWGFGESESWLGCEKRRHALRGGKREWLNAVRRWQASPYQWRWWRMHYAVSCCIGVIDFFIFIVRSLFPLQIYKKI